MLRRYIILMVSILLSLSLIAPVVTLGETQNGIVLPNLTYLTVSESDGEVYSVRTYLKDGQMYLEMEGQLYAMDILKEVVSPILEENLEEISYAFEVREVGEEILDGHRTVHSQIFSGKTGLLEQEIWQALDLLLPLPLKTISYDTEENVISITQVQSIEFDPDFSELDFSNALQIPALEEPLVATQLTTEEFKKMVPWYDLSLQPLPNYELLEIEYVSTYGAL